MRNYAEEFKTIDILENSDAESRGIDSFALAIIKVERQSRKLFTFLIFQYPCFRSTPPAALRDLLWKKRIYSSGILEGINLVAPKTISDLIGVEYATLFDTVKKATDIRNKIFHGQITNQRLGQPDLFDYVHALRRWCSLLGEAAEAAFGYDGFRNNSYQKTTKVGFAGTLKRTITSIGQYELLLDLLQQINPLKS